MPMKLTYSSRTLERTLSLDDLASLDSTDLKILHAELLMAVQSMDTTMAEADETAKRKSIPLDYEWLARVRHKRRICATFIEQIKLALGVKPQREQLFQAAYLKHLEELMLEELGSAVFQELKNEAHQAALQDMQQTTTPLTQGAQS